MLILRTYVINNYIMIVKSNNNIQINDIILLLKIMIQLKSIKTIAIIKSRKRFVIIKSRKHNNVRL